MNPTPRKTGRPKGPTPPMVVLSVRLPADLVAYLDRYATELQARVPGSTMTRADAIRALVAEAAKR
jgi:hypothetical protein